MVWYGFTRFAAICLSVATSCEDTRMATNYFTIPLAGRPIRRIRVNGSSDSSRISEKSIGQSEYAFRSLELAWDPLMVRMISLFS